MDREHPVIYVGFCPTVEISSQVIGEPETGVWCAICSAPSAALVDVALLVMPFGLETYEVDPVRRLARLHACSGCGEVFEMPDSPVLRDNRG